MLTKRQKQVLEYIEKYLKDHDYSPTLEEVKRHFRLSSISTVHQHIEALKNKGYLDKQSHRARSIEPKSNSENSSVKIPLLGYIAAGEPIEAVEDSKAMMVPQSYLSRSGDHFALRVRGNSMIEEGIFNNDTVIIRKQERAENGETVVALLNGNKVTLKKIYQEKGRFRLQPANPDLKPIYVNNLQIQGKVISIVRSFKKTNRKRSDRELCPETIKYINETDIEYRKSKGQFFTPKSIREALLARLPKNLKKPKILDPACGTGEFLMTAEKYFNQPRLFGWEIDKKLARISKKVVTGAEIKNIDSLKNDSYGKFDLVIGNPPYFEFSPSNEIKERFREVINGRINIFSLFIFQGLNWLKKGGYLAFVLPPSMNNGAYFLKLRKFIVRNSNIEHLKILDSAKLFKEAQQSTMLLILKKGENKGDYLFQKNGILIFTERSQYLRDAFKKKLTLNDLGYEVRTGRLIWNENKGLLTNNPSKGIPLIWSHNITQKGLRFPINNPKKPQYVKREDPDLGPAIVVNRITGSVKSSELKSAIIPKGMKFIAENHVNVIFPPAKRKQTKMDLGFKPIKNNLSLIELSEQLSSKEKTKVVRKITGNTQISKTELLKLFPISTE